MSAFGTFWRSSTKHRLDAGISKGGGLGSGPNTRRNYTNARQTEVKVQQTKVNHSPPELHLRNTIQPLELFNRARANILGLKEKESSRRFTFTLRSVQPI